MSTMTWDTPALRTGGQSRLAARPAGSALAHRLGEAPQGSSIRLTGRGRLAVWAAAVLVATGVLLSAQGAEAGAPVSAESVVARTIAPGETLWAVAAEITAPGQDVRDTVALLEDLNELPSAGLQAGQQILVPSSALTD